ncbi:MAG: LysR family transcriptional regulator [bacterium]
MDVHLRDLRYFAAVAEELSFTRAAERLHLSQPALSKQIRGLERTLRARLFDRDRRLVRLTAAGEALLETARLVLAEWDDGTTAVAGAAALELRTLRVGTLTAIGHEIYPRAVSGFGQRQPGWRIELRSFGWDDPTAGLRDRATDVAFLWLPVDARDVTYHVLLSERRFVVLSSRHRLAGRTAATFDELAGEPFVSLPLPAGPLRDFWLGAEEGRPAAATVAAEAASADEKLEIIAAGVGIGLVSEGNAAVYTRPGIVCVPVTDLGPARLAVAWRSGDQRLAVHAFVQSCLEAVGEATGAHGATPLRDTSR